MEALVQLLKTCETLLRQVGETFWAEKINHIITKSNGRIDIYCAQEIISWYGGMGSFNDLTISLHNDHSVEEENEGTFNKKLIDLRRKIYEEAKRLQYK